MEAYNILLIGGGGREHALAWGLSKSPMTKKLFITPGNPGTAKFGENVSLNTDNHEAVLEFIEEHEIGLTVIGPEKPLVDGLTDFLEGNDKPVFGPTAEAALLEGSKSFAKDMMNKYSVPTASSVSFERHEWSKAHEFVGENTQWPLVLKADGLAAGKGVFICDTPEEATDVLELMQNDPSLSGASYRIVIEEFMTGEEVSVFALCDGETAKVISIAQDHKRIGDGDTGLNTGGMGAYCQAPQVSEELKQTIIDTIIQPMISGMANDGIPYKGILYAGLMLTESGPKVVEFNVRFGDPECQVIIPSLKTDLVELIFSSITGKLEYIDVEIDDSYYTCIVASSSGYPGKSSTGFEITGLGDVENDDVFVFHAGTSLSEDGKLINSGGRVLNVVAKADNLAESIQKAYDAITKISFEGMYYRKDIGKKGLRYM